MLAFRDLKDEAATVHTIAAEAADRLADRRGVAITQQAGKIEYDRGNWAQSRSLFKSAEAVFAADGDRLGLARCYMDMARQERLKGKLGSARDRYLALVEASHDVDPAMEAMGLLGLGQIQLSPETPMRRCPSWTSPCGSVADVSA
jgi:hypothetical protein